MTTQETELKIKLLQVITERTKEASETKDFQKRFEILEQVLGLYKNNIIYTAEIIADQEHHINWNEEGENNTIKGLDQFGNVWTGTSIKNSDKIDNVIEATIKAPDAPNDSTTVSELPS